MRACSTATAADGLRKCLAEEFCSIYVFHLRGNQRTSGEQLTQRKAAKIFGSGSRAPIAITLLVKNPDAAKNGRDSFSRHRRLPDREEKLASISRVSAASPESQQLTAGEASLPTPMATG